MDKHIYVIGTERQLVESFYCSYLKEVQFIQNSTNKETIFAVIDESQENIAKINSEIINRNKVPDVNVVHFNKKMQKDLFDYIGRMCSDKSIIDLLDYEGYSYGRVMNKQFLAASLYNADFLHRRDSDVKIMYDTFGFPSEIENKYLGKTISELEVYNTKGKENFTPDQVVYMAGSGYSGKSSWKADFGIFMDKDIELIEQVTKLFKYGDDLSEEYLKEILEGNVSITTKELFLPENNHPNPICGNISMYKIFNYLPCSNILSTVGSDNLIRGLLKRLHSPIVYHTNFVYHHFGKERDSSNTDYLLSYWPRMINKLIYYRLIEKLIYDFEKTKIQRIVTLDDLDFPNLINSDELTYEYVYSVSKECIDSYLDIMKCGKNPKFQILKKQFETQIFLQWTADNMYNGLKKGVKLLKHWAEIIDICKNCSIAV